MFPIIPSSLHAGHTIIFPSQRHPVWFAINFAETSIYFEVTCSSQTLNCMMSSWVHGLLVGVECNESTVKTYLYLRYSVDRIVSRAFNTERNI